MNPKLARPSGRRLPRRTVVHRIALVSVLATTAAGVGPAAAGTAPGCSGGWQVVPSQDRTGQHTAFTAATAVPSGGAWAVGTPSYVTTRADERYRALVESWTGSSWRIAASPRLSTHSELLGVTATSASDAWAVGQNGDHALIEHWNGRSWAVTASPGGSTPSRLDAVASYGAQAWAVGFIHSTTGVPLILHERNGRWQRETGPAIEGTELTGVTVAADGSAWAVGAAGQPPRLVPLIEHRTSQGWRRVPAPAAAGDAVLRGIASSPTGDLWAVGTYVARQPLLLRYHHGRWTLLPVPYAGSYGGLGSVTVFPNNHVWAVGTAFPRRGARHTLIEEWNGSTVKPVADPSTGRPALTGVAALSSGTVLAVGTQHPISADQHARTYAEAVCAT